MNKIIGSQCGNSTGLSKKNTKRLKIMLQFWQSVTSRNSLEIISYKRERDFTIVVTVCILGVTGVT